MPPYLPNRRGKKRLLMLEHGAWFAANFLRILSTVNGTQFPLHSTPMKPDADYLKRVSKRFVGLILFFPIRIVSQLLIKMFIGNTMWLSFVKIFMVETSFSIGYHYHYHCYYY